MNTGDSIGLSDFASKHPPAPLKTASIQESLSFRFAHSEFRYLDFGPDGNDIIIADTWKRYVGIEMPLPQLSESQINGVIRQVAEYIESQRQTYRDKATPLDKNQKAVMGPFFPESVLNSAKVLTLDHERVANPHFYPDLVRLGFPQESLPDFAEMAAITFVDTIVSHGPMSKQTLFHELVHAVQYENLGLADFAAKYVKGFLSGGSYEAIPLEQNAYELDARFARAPANAFSVEDEVQEWIVWELF